MKNWEEKREKLYNTIFRLHELNSIRDGYQECKGFTRNAIVSYYIQHMHTIHLLALIYYFYINNTSCNQTCSHYILFLEFSIQLTIFMCETTKLFLLLLLNNTMVVPRITHPMNCTAGITTW